MPYIRLYSREVPLDEKRWIAQRLISITQRTFHLLPEHAGDITIQFLPRYKSPAIGDAAEGGSAGTPEITLEVSSEKMQADVVSAFVEAAAPMLSHSAAVGRRGQLARMLRIGANETRQIAFQFNQLNSGVSEVPVVFEIKAA
ncbi:MAG TPA: hypothetical protein VGG15_08590 [Terriglobales bacterium]|jgi:hypothetical protein